MKSRNCPTKEAIKCIKCQDTGFVLVSEYFLGIQGRKDCGCPKSCANAISDKMIEKVKV
jgi:hypothetical protein